MPDPKKKVEVDKGVTDECMSCHAFSRDTSPVFSDLDLVAAALNELLYSGGKPQDPKNQQRSNMACVAVAQGSDGTLYVAFNSHTDSGRTMPTTSQLKQLHPAELGILYDVAGDSETGEAKPSEQIKMGNNVNVVMRNSEKKMILRKYTKKPVNPGGQVFDPVNAIKIMLDTIYREDLKTKRPPVMLLGGMKGAQDHAEMRIMKYFMDKGMTLPAVGVSKPCCHLCADALEKKGVTYSRWMQVTQHGKWWTPPADITTTEAETKKL